MASVTLTASDRFPAGTSVSAYPVANWPAHLRPPAGAPVGASAATAVVAAAGTLAFTGLSEGTDYVAYALVSGQHRYVSFRVTEGSEGTVQQRLAALEGAVKGTRMWRSGNLAMPALAGAVTAVPLTSVEYNSDTDVFELSGGGILVKQAGLADVAYGANFVGGSEAARNVQLVKNGTMIRDTGSVGVDARPNGAAGIQIAEGDVLSLTAWGGSVASPSTLEGAGVKDIGIDVLLFLAL